MELSKELLVVWAWVLYNTSVWMCLIYIFNMTFAQAGLILAVIIVPSVVAYLYLEG